jgi:TPR repeat protein
VKWYRKAADQGLANAQSNLGNRYATGTGVAKDEVEAVKWFRKAADQGYAAAQYNLGTSYAKGRGVAKDEVEAYAYWSLARNTDVDARKILAALEKKLSPEARLRGQQRTKELQKEIEAKWAGK